MVILLKRIQKNYTNSITIQKSEFITYLFRVNTILDVENYLNQIRKKHYDATHNCYAYIIGENQEIQKCSDDGEPQKTAGMPMIDVLKKNNLTYILAITTRYFGGILLGAGGLVRAYSTSVSECLKKAEFYDVREQIKFKLTLSYTGYNTLLKTLNYLNIIEVSYTLDVIILATCDTDKFDKLKNDIYKYKIGTNDIEVIEKTYIEVLV